MLEAIAIKSIVMKDPDYFTRRVCRYYSEKFHTPLVEVIALPWGFVFNNYIEHVIESNNSRDDIVKLAIDICCPELAVSEEEELQQWIKKIEDREQEKKADKIIEDKMKQDQMPSLDMGSFDHLDEEMEEDV